MSTFLVNGPEENFNKSLVKPIELEVIKSSNISENVIEKLEKYNGSIFCWAWKSKTDKGRESLKKYRDGMKEDDTLLFIKNGRKKESENSQTIMYRGNVICCDRNKDFAYKVWGLEYKDKFDFIIFLKDVKRITNKLYLEDFIAGIRQGNKKFFCPNAYQLKDYEEEYTYEKFGTILGIKSESSLNNVNDIEEQINKNNDIRKLEDFIGKYTNLDLNKIEYNKLIKKGINKKNQSKSNKNIARKELHIDEYSKKLIGYLGEEKVFKILKEKDKNLYKLLNINNKNTDIIWFNENQDITSENYLDQSVGYGYDMYIQSTDKKIVLEIKTSYEDMNLLNFTHNEINTMKACMKNKEVYYVVIVDRLINLTKDKSPRLTIVKNFSDSISEDYIAFSNNHTIYANKLIERYGVNNHNNNFLV